MRTGRERERDGDNGVIRKRKVEERRRRGWGGWRGH